MSSVEVTAQGWATGHTLKCSANDWCTGGNGSEYVAEFLVASLTPSKTYVGMRGNRMDINRFGTAFICFVSSQLSVVLFSTLMQVFLLLFYHASEVFFSVKVCSVSMRLSLQVGSVSSIHTKYVHGMSGFIQLAFYRKRESRG